LPSLLVQAAKSAAEADGLAPPPLNGSSPSPSSHHSNNSSNNNNNSSNDSNNNNSNNAALVAALAKMVQQNQQQQQQQQHSSAAAAMERARTALAMQQMQAAKPPPTHSSAAMMMNHQKSPDPPSSSGGKKKGPPLRRGKWTAEEEGYANRLITEFKAGLLPLTDGTTLRTFLSKLLNCDPMRISKKFVGSNCIGKQVFRRRTADINRLTPEQIHQSRVELSELERRFLERVAQTNRVKSSGVASGVASSGSAPAEEASDKKASPPSPPWLQPPLGYKQGNGAAMAAAALSSSVANQRAAAAGRALLGGVGSSNPSMSSRGSAGLLADLGRSNSRASLFNSFGSDSANDILHALRNSGGGSTNNLFSRDSNAGLSGSAMAQMARNASAARLAGLAAAGSSMNNLLLKSGLSRDQLSQLARDGGMSSASLTNMMDRQSSFDALMSLDLQSLQSIDNLANLIQSGSAMPGSIPQAGMKNADFSNIGRTSNPSMNGNSGGMADLANARRLASIGRMESLLRSLSSQNVNKLPSNNGGGGGSNANFNNLLQSMQNNLNNSGSSNNSLFGSNNHNSHQNFNLNSASALSLANLFRADSSTGLTALRMQDGLNQRNSSVDDFLSLVAAGDIPHQDPALLNLSLMQHQQQGALASALGGSFGNRLSAASLMQQQQQARAALAGLGSSSSALKRKLMELEGSLQDQQGNPKR
jgi:hypothetical protein